MSSPVKLSLLASSAPTPTSPRVDFPRRRVKSEKKNEPIFDQRVREEVSRFDATLEQKKNFLSLLKQITADDRKSLEEAFRELIQPEHEWELVDLIASHFSDESSTIDAGSDFRGNDSGTTVWCAYMRSKLSLIFSEEEVGQLALASIENDKPYDFWKKIVASLIANPHQLTILASLNDKLCKSDPEMEKKLVQATCLHYFSAEIRAYGMRAGKVNQCTEIAKTLSKFLNGSYEKLSSLKELLIRKEETSLYYAFSHYDGSAEAESRVQEYFDRTQNELKRQIEQAMPGLIQLKSSMLALLITNRLKHEAAEQCIDLRPETAGTLIWRNYLAKQLGDVFPQNNIGKAVDAALKSTDEIFWKRIEQYLALKSAEITSLKAVNRCVVVILGEKKESVFFRAVVTGYLIPQIMEYAREKNNLAGYKDFIKSIQEHPFRQNLVALLTEE